MRRRQRRCFRRRAIVPVLLLSILILTVIYLLVNISMLSSYCIAAFSSSDAVAADLMGKAFGSWGERALGVFVAMYAASKDAVHISLFVMAIGMVAMLLAGKVKTSPV